jgi:uncharacterized protein (TIGR03437 family)
MTSRSFSLQASLASSLFILLSLVNLSQPAQAQGVGIAVVNAASFEKLFPVAPGSLVSGFAVDPTNQAPQIFAGAPAGQNAPSIPLPVDIGGVQVLVNNVASPLLFVRAGSLGANPVPGQVNFQIPGATPEGKNTVKVLVNGTEVASGFVNVFNPGPGLFFNSADPVFPGIVQNFPGFALNGPGSPTTRGGVVIAYGTGQGPLDVPVADGNNPGATPAKPTLAVKCFVGVEEVTPDTAMQSEFVSLWQLNVPIPDKPSVSGRMPFFCTVGGISTNVVSIWVAE